MAYDSEININDQHVVHDRVPNDASMSRAGSKAGRRGRPQDKGVDQNPSSWRWGLS